MKLQTNASDLKTLLKVVGKAIENRPISTYMSFVLLEAQDDELKATATNGMYTISNRIQCKVKEAGSDLLDGKMLCQFVEKLPFGEVTLEVDSKGALLKYGKSKTKIGVSAEDFTKPKEYEPTSKATVEPDVLRSCVNTVKYAASLREDQRATMNGILLSFSNDTLRAVATDGFRIAARKGFCDASEPIDVIIPVKSAERLLETISGKEPVELATDGKFLESHCGNTHFRTTLLAGNFINYRQIVPTEFECKVIADIDELRSALERTMLIAEGTSAIKLQTDTDGVTIRANGNTGADSMEQIECDVRGKEQNVAYNGRYIVAALNATECKGGVWLKISNAVRPTVIVPDENPDEMHIVLPVRVY